MTAGRWLQFGALSLLLALGGCGGSSSGGDTANGGMGGSGSGNGQYAEGGMGGSGSGTSSGYGSIYLNDNRRHYPIDENADVFLDGERVDPATINPQDKGLPLGMTLEFLLAGDANANLTSGTAIRIRADHRVIGPVTGTDPLEVLGQPVLVTSETLLAEPLSSSAVENLSPGDVVKVDGLVNYAGVIRATRIEKPAVSPTEWQLMGRAVNVVPGSSLEIHGQAVEIFNATYINCDGDSPVEDQRVLVRAQSGGGFQSGDTLTGTLTVECLPEGLSLFANDPPDPDVTTLPATVDAIITDLPEADLADGEITLNLNGQEVLVRVSDLAEVLFGTLDQLQPGTRIEVDGTLDTASGVITAESIRFRDPLITLVAPVDGGVVGRLLLALGIEVRPTPEMQGGTLFDTPGTLGQAELSGFITDDGVVYAESLATSGAADPSSVSFTGPVTAVDDGVDTVTLFTGKVFDTASATNVSLLDATGDLLTDVLCSLLGFCLNNPPDLEGEVPEDGSAVGAVSGASWNVAQSRLENGDLKITLPPDTSP